MEFGNVCVCTYVCIYVWMDRYMHTFPWFHIFLDGKLITSGSVKFAKIQVSLYILTVQHAHCPLKIHAAMFRTMYHMNAEPTYSQDLHTKHKSHSRMYTLFLKILQETLTANYTQWQHNSWYICRHDTKINTHATPFQFRGCLGVLQRKFWYTPLSLI